MICASSVSQNCTCSGSGSLGRTTSSAAPPTLRRSQNLTLPSCAPAHTRCRATFGAWTGTLHVHAFTTKTDEKRGTAAGM